MMRLGILAFVASWLVAASRVAFAAPDTEAEPASGDASPAGPSSGVSSDVEAGRLGVPLQYEAPTTCIKEEAFVAAVERRVSAGDGAPPIGLKSLIVGIEASEQGYVGTLRLRLADRTTGGREVAAPECSDVADALAAVTAIALRAQPVGDASPETGTSSEPSRKKGSSRAQKQRASSAKPEAPPRSDKKRLRHALGSRPDWIRRDLSDPFKTHHETEVPAGTLNVDEHTLVGAQVGVGYGRVPGVLVPRVDLTIAVVLSLTTPGEEPLMLGFIPRLRVGFLPAVEKVTGDVVTELDGSDAALGLCLSPYFNEEGLLLLGCLEYGWSLLFEESTSADGSESLRVSGSGAATVTLDAGYQLWSPLFLGIRAGVTRVMGDARPVLDSEGILLFSLGRDELFATAGLGAYY